ncbi:hypothetical protein G9C85_11455 [Halorubellus sp. JP-L1]|uniref:hypothetical protein n=1 Tax=Halorubellus sp. JP-L1 TaxID=2715753 RepID=UPI0014081B5E|nr:hypothetical protein [Halorubellus sp. JP-L1]
MDVTPATVVDEYEWVRERADAVVPLINAVRDDLGDLFEVDVDHVTADQYRGVVDETFADGDRAVNVAALTAILRDLDVEGDYPGFVVDEVLGRELAGTIAGGQPLRMLGEATFHYADIHTHGEDDEAAGADDLDAALAAGVQEHVPGWGWTEEPSPFAVADAVERANR